MIGALISTSTLDIVAVIGSLRRESYSRIVFDAATTLVDDDVALTEAPIADLPLFNQDLEAGGDPPAVAELKRRVDSADALVLFTPEYNHSIPAVTKNVIDWLSRVPGDSVIGRTVVGAVATTPGRHGAAGVRDHLAHVLAIVTPTVYEPMLGVAGIRRRVAEGRVSDEELLSDLASWLHGFVAHVRKGVHGADD